MDSPANPQPVMCEVCGTYFETRRGLSSHARLHLRQLGVTVSDSSGAPIDLLYQIVQERGGSFPDLKSGSSEHELKKTSQKVSRTPPVPEDRSAVFTEGTAVTTTSLKMVQRGSSSKLKESASFLSGCEFVEFKKREGSSSSPPELQTSTKPLWAPLETDAPITLDTGEEVHVCQLCGSWYESRKGLASHARSHLRQMGIPDSEIKGNPIDHLYQLMEDEDLKPFSVEQQRDSPSNSPPKLPVKRPPNPSSPSALPLSKQSKASEEYTCILCGENFDNRKGLACHARFHLKQMGVADLLGKSSAIDTVQELVKSGMLKALQFSKTHSKSSSSAAPAPPTGARGPQTPLPSSSSSLSPAKSTPGPPANKAPKAKKGFRLAVDPLHRKPKPEPVELPLQTQGCGKDSSSPVIKSPAAADLYLPLDAEASTDEPPTVLCDYCGQLFETRKALSCHARAHLRQLGLNWSIKSSPLDLLKEFMEHGEEGLKAAAASGESLGKATWTPPMSKRSPDSLQSGEAAAKPSPSPLDFSTKDKSPSSKSFSLHKDTSCKLCGFDFENRKALASHARAHLRQLGIKEWKADGVGSPIKLLNEMIKRDPAKISAITRRYRSGDFYIKKGRRGSAAASMSPDSKPVPGSSLKAAVHHHQHKKGKDDFGLSRHPQGHLKTFGTHSDSSAHSRSGAHPLRHLTPAQEDNQDSNSQQPSRSGSIPAMLPKPPLTPLVKLVGKMYSLKCRFCEKVFHGPLSVQEQWITHLQEHILSLGYKGKASPPAAPVAAPALVHPVSV